MEGHAVADLGFSPADVADMVSAFSWARDLAYAEIFRRGRFDWTSFYTTNEEWPACAGPFVSKDTCASDLRALCAADAPVQSKAVSRPRPRSPGKPPAPHCLTASAPPAI